MPNRDQTGPDGKGPLTGNADGDCDEQKACDEQKTITSGSPDAVSAIYSPVPQESFIHSAFDPELEDESRRRMLKDKYFPGL